MTTPEPEPNAKAPTPETDALFTECFGCEVNDYTPNQKKALEHARRLERERDEAKEARDHANGLLFFSCPNHAKAARQLDPMCSICLLANVNTITRERDEARAQRDKLSKATATRDKLRELLREAAASFKRIGSGFSKYYGSEASNMMRKIDSALIELAD